MRTENKILSKILFVFRAGISIGLLTWALSRIRKEELIDVASGANLWVLFLCFLLFQVGMLLRTFRWSILLTTQGFDLKFSLLLLLNYSGAFFNIVLPTGFGGDVVRMLEINENQPGEKMAAAFIVLLDRLSGLSVLFILCLVALIFSRNVLPSNLFLALIGIASCGTFGNFLLFFRKPLIQIRALTKYFPGGSAIDKVLAAIINLSPRVFFAAWLISFVFHVLIITIHYLVSRALHANVPYFLFGAFTPIVSLSLLLPSFQGLGIRENIYSFLLSQSGYATTLGLTIGLLIYAINMITGLVGGLFYLLYGIFKSASRAYRKNSGRLEI